MEDERPLFQGMDELERTYAPEELPPDDPEGARARMEERDGGEEGASLIDEEPPSAAPVANLGNAPSAAAAPPNIGHENRGGAPGDPETEAGYPLGSKDKTPNRE